MKRDIDYAKLCQHTYDAPEATLTVGNGRHENFAFAKSAVDGLPVLCFRGSKKWRDWLLDLFAFPLFDIHTTPHLTLGPLHGGMLIGANALYPAVLEAISGGPYALCGHSLGGGLATVVAAMLTKDNRAPVEVVTFGAPRVGMDPLARALDPVAIRQYRYGNDMIPMVPTHPPFIHARTPLVNVGHAMKGVWADHHITAYLDALETIHGTEAAPALAG